MYLTGGGTTLRVPVLVQLLMLLLLLPEQQFLVTNALRCKCNTNHGASACNGHFCDVHNDPELDGKRAACGAVRRRQQTIFACVLIRQTSNDTYCHVVGSATACWCRAMDFCNADLESELFDIETESDSWESEEEFHRSTTDAEQIASERQPAVSDAHPWKLHPATDPSARDTSDLVMLLTSSSTRATAKTSTTQTPAIRIRPAVRVQMATDKMVLTPVRELELSTATADSESVEYYDDELDDENDNTVQSTVADDQLVTKATILNDQQTDQSSPDDTIVEFEVTKSDDQLNPTTSTNAQTQSISEVEIGIFKPFLERVRSSNHQNEANASTAAIAHRPVTPMIRATFPVDDSVKIRRKPMNESGEIASPPRPTLGPTTPYSVYRPPDRLIRPNPSVSHDRAQNPDKRHQSAANEIADDHHRTDTSSQCAFTLHCSSLSILVLIISLVLINVQF